MIEQIIFLIGDLGYIGIYVMMTLESSFIPFPSEVAMIPAGYLASLGEMSFLLAFLCGTLWALTGASVNYFLWNYLGRPVVQKLIKSYGKYIFLQLSHYEKSEKYFKEHGSITTLIGRFIPAVRQLISIPAGIFSMNIWKFLFFTGVWAGIWNLILMIIWYVAGENRDLIAQYTTQIMIFLVVILTIILVAYIWNKKRK